MLGSFDLETRRLSRNDWIRGLGGSLLIHGLVFSMALAGMWSLPRKSVQGSFTTVNLVSSQEFGLDSGALRKGSRDALSEGPKAQESASTSTPSRAKPGPVVPIKRLSPEESPRRAPVDIKRLDAPEVPRFGEKSQAVSVDKELDKLIPKAKPLPKPTVQESAAQAGRSGEGGSDQAADKKARVSQESVKGSPEGGAKGTAEGHAKGTADSGGKGSAASSGAGSPDGEQVATALRVYYIAVTNAIRKQWNLPEYLKKQDLETVIVLVLRRDGRVMDLRVEKKSGQPLVDDTAVRAIRKAEPLPPFPEIYSRQQMEFEISLRPQDLR